MAPCAAFGSMHVRCCPQAGRTSCQAAFRPQRGAGTPGRRRQLIIRTAEADRSKSQDTVGDLSPDQVKAALDRQLQFAAAKKGQDSSSANSEPAPAAASAEEEEPAPQSELKPATDEEREASVKALEELKKRVPHMAQSDVQGAIDRLLSRKSGGGEASAGGSGKSSSGATQGGNTDNAQPAAQTGGSPQKAQTGGSPQKAQTGGSPQKAQTGGSPQKAQSGGSPQKAQTGGSPQKAQTGGSPQKAQTGGSPNKAPSGGSQNKASSGGSQKKGKHEPDNTYDDGSVLFTAESLAKVSFDELKP